MNTHKFFTDEQKLQILKAINEAEKTTSGEIRLHVEKDCEGDAYERAVKVFHQLHMHKTKHRNGVLFYLAIGHRKLAIVGDEGIHKKVSDSFWVGVKDHMIKRFGEGNYAQGICEGVEVAGKELEKHFPKDSKDKNQLPDEISFGH